MIPQHQTTFGKGRGNCFAACIASILEVTLDAVPDMHQFTNWREAINEWLQQFGLFYIDVSLPGDMRDELVAFWGYHIISGDGPRGLRHAVVGHKGYMVFDPHPDGGGISGDLEYGFLIPIDPHCIAIPSNI